MFTLSNYLILSLIHLALTKSAFCIAGALSNKTIGNDNPEFYYVYDNKKHTILRNIGITLLCFIPLLQTGLLFFWGINPLIYLANSAIKRKFKPYDYKKINVKYYHVDTPEQRLQKLKDGEKAYRAIKDSLIMEGLDKNKINSFMRTARKESRYLNKDNSKPIAECEQRIRNLRLLSTFKEYLKDPYKAYKYTLKRKIQRADIDPKSNKLIIETTKPNQVIQDTKKNKQDEKYYDSIKKEWGLVDLEHEIPDEKSPECVNEVYRKKFKLR